MIIGFKSQFIKPIIEETKIHTIREDKHNRWNTGVIMHMATGVRTKKYNQFAEAVCESTQDIDIWHTAAGVPFVYVDNRLLNTRETVELCENDGFSGEQDFFEWFDKNFKGKIIHWTNKKY